MRHYGGAEAGVDRIVHVPRGEQYALTIRTDSGGRIERIKSGPGWTDAAHEALKTRIQTELLADLGQIIYRYPVLTAKPTMGWFRSTKFQLRPAPDAAPRPPGSWGDHPAVLECQVKRSADQAVQLQRAQRRAREIVWMLNALLWSRVHMIGPRIRQHWGIDVGQGSLQPIWVQEFYDIAGLAPPSDDFTKQEGDDLPTIPADKFYGSPWIGAALAVPDTLAELLAASDSLPLHEQSKVLRAAQWIAAADEFFQTLSGGYVLAHVAALETLAFQKHPQQPCATCGKDQGPGPTKRFRDFVESYAPGGNVKMRQRIYTMRSSIVHGEYQMLADASRVGSPFSTAALNEGDLVTELWRTSRLAFVNWLVSQAAKAGARP